MSLNIGPFLLGIAAVVALFTALAHLSCIVLGPTCYEAQLAPPQIVQSAIDGTWIAPVGTVAISALFLLCAAYALSRAGFIRQLPLVGLASITIVILCILRGLLTFQLKYRHPELVDTYNFIIGSVWFITGLLFWFGHKLVQRNSRLKYG